MAGACTVLLVALAISSARDRVEVSAVPVQRDLIASVEPWAESHDGNFVDARTRVTLKSLGGQRPAPMYVVQAPADVRRLRCDPVVGE